MKLTRVIIKFVSYIYSLFTYRSHAVAFAFAQNNLPLNTASFVHRKGEFLHFDGNPKNQFPLRLINAYSNPQLNYLVRLLNNGDVFLTNAAKDNLTFTVNGINYNVASPVNLGVVNEMFYDNHYNISALNPCVLLDIGMNVGYVSLYFSSFPNIKKVYSYEPFKDTFVIAQQNLAANEAASKKIQPNNYGISNYTGTIDVPLLAAGTLGASTEASYIKDHVAPYTNTVQVQVRDILEVLKEIREENPGTDIAMKIDCEGEEYNILETMNDHNGFEKVTFLCIEWHFKGAARIKEILHQNNFIVFDMAKGPAVEYDMIYGFRTANS
jgi:FkbM family methyltransferase